MKKIIGNILCIGGGIAGGIFFGINIGGFWWVVLGVFVGLVIGAIIDWLMSLVTDPIARKRVETEKKRLAENEQRAEQHRMEEAQRKERELEEKWIDLSCDAKVTELLNMTDELREKFFALSNEEEQLAYRCAEIEHLNTENENKYVTPKETAKEALKKVSTTYHEKETQYGCNPENALVQYDKVPKNWEITLYVNTRDGAIEVYERLADVCKYFESRYKISQKEMDIANTRYNYIREKAVLSIWKLKLIIDNFTPKQVELFNEAQKMGLGSE
jgi:hypothetical protein